MNWLFLVSLLFTIASCVAELQKVECQNNHSAKCTKDQSDEEPMFTCPIRKPRWVENTDFPPNDRNLKINHHIKPICESCSTCPSKKTRCNKCKNSDCLDKVDAFHQKNSRCTERHDPNDYGFCSLTHSSNLYKVSDKPGRSFYRDRGDQECPLSCSKCRNRHSCVDCDSCKRGNRNKFDSEFESKDCDCIHKGCSSNMNEYIRKIHRKNKWSEENDESDESVSFNRHFNSNRKFKYVDDEKNKCVECETNNDGCISKRKYDSLKKDRSPFNCLLVPICLCPPIENDCTKISIPIMCSPMINKCNLAEGKCPKIIDVRNSLTPESIQILNRCYPMVKTNTPFINVCKSSIAKSFSGINGCTNKYNSLDCCSAQGKNPTIRECACNEKLCKSHTGCTFQANTCIPQINVCTSAINGCTSPISRSTLLINGCTSHVGECTSSRDKCALTSSFNGCTSPVCQCSPSINQCNTPACGCSPSIDNCTPSANGCISSITECNGCNSQVNGCSPTTNGCSLPINGCPPLVDGCNAISNGCNTRCTVPLNSCSTGSPNGEAGDNEHQRIKSVLGGTQFNCIFSLRCPTCGSLINFKACFPFNTCNAFGLNSN